ncbi:MFS transporter [Actinoplanes flavus]|uniref:MFS transporter n=1 Tax=Actinoplanes flavus TaxID=2820290 RepID=A0ABS3UR21_9ACTN|nr:MFS transporter [Actinoplanes flavus]MBO3741229.1 MFS transporter [Actinoplanes flavus]
MALGSDFRRLWAAYAASEIGTGIGFGALPLVAILVLEVPAWQVSLLATMSGLAAAAVAVPAGPWVEFRRKRPVMVGADLARALALFSVPVALWFDVLGYGQLGLVAAIQAAAAILFAAASGAHLKALVAPGDRATATGRMEATFWTAYSAGPPIGGALTSWVGVGWTVTVDAVSFLLSAAGVRSLRGPEPEPPRREPGTGRWAEIGAGWRYVFAHRDLRALFLNAQLFGSGMMAASPLLAVLMLDELDFPAWQYGIGWGIPCLGGVLGALALAPLTRRFGRHRVLLWSGVWRAVWLCLLAFLPAGLPGLLLMIVVETFALFATGVFNPAFAVYRMEQTEDHYMTRVISAWSISSRICQPVGIALGGLLAALTDVRTALAICGLAVAGSVVLLPWRHGGPGHRLPYTPEPGSMGDRRTR